MATGDIIACEVDSTGSFAYITVEGWSASAGFITYAYGDVTNGAGNVAFTVVSEGYDTVGNLGTVTRTLYAYDTVRKAKPDDASLDEVVVGSDLKIRVALSRDVYDDDNTGAGKSGTAPTVTVAASWATSSSPSRTSNAVTNLTVTNSSTLDYPVAFGQHDPVAGTLMRSRVKSDFAVAFNARHGEGIACVRWNATGGTSGHTQEVFSTVQTKTERTATGLYACAYGSSIPLSGFTQAETITVRARVYPVVGDANSILDTNGRTTAANECLGWNDLIVICDKNNALDAIKYVSTTGNDTTGDGSSGNPWLTINKAIKDTGTNIVRLMGTATTYDLTFSGTRRTATSWIVVEPDTGATPTVRMINTSAAARQPKIERLLFQNLPVLKSAANSYLDGDDADNFLAFVNCTFNDGGFGSSGDAGPGYRFDATYMLNCDGDLNRTQWRISTFSTARSAYIFDGIAFAVDVAGASGLDAWFRVVACSGTNQSFAFKSSSNPAPTFDGVLFDFNSFLDNTLTSANVLILDRALSGASIVGNVLEKTAGSGAIVHLVADATAAAMTNVVMAHNTIVGSTSGRRVNLFYNDQGTTPYNHKSVFLLGNHIDEGNIKSDDFGHTAVSITRSGSTATLTCASADSSIAYTVGQNIFISGAGQAEYNGTFAVATSSGTIGGGTLTFTVAGTPATPATGTISYWGLGRVGNWAQLYGSKWRSNNVDTNSSPTFDWENLGVDGTRETPTWVNAAANDYTPAAGDPFIGRIGQPYVPFDLYGRRFSGSACLGAVQIVQANVVGFIGGSLQGIIGS
jgi:hypothetical protein